MLNKYKYISHLTCTILIVISAVIGTYGTSYGKECQIRSGAYIAHEKQYIDEAWMHVWEGRWSQLPIMLKQGKLRKICRTWNINPLQITDNLVKFSINVAPGKEIWTLKMFTTCK